MSVIVFNLYFLVTSFSSSMIQLPISSPASNCLGTWFAYPDKSSSMQSFRMSRYERHMVARRHSRLKQVGATYEFSRFEYVLTVFVDHTSSKCDRITVKNEDFLGVNGVFL